MIIKIPFEFQDHIYAHFRSGASVKSIAKKFDTHECVVRKMIRDSEKRLAELALVQPFNLKNKYWNCENENK